MWDAHCHRLCSGLSVMTQVRASRFPKFRHAAGLLAAVAIPGRECNGSTLCCNCLACPAIDKPARQWCQHCAPGKGCSIYRDRPGVCQTWNCGWQILRSLGEEWYPLRSKIVINPNISPDPDHSAIDVHVDPAY